MLNPGTENLESSPTDASDNSESLTVEQAIANLSGTDLGLRFYAAWWLGRFRVKEVAAVTGLIKALDDEDDRTPEGGYPLRRNAARALGKLGDRQVVPALIQSLQCSDFYVREAAAQSLEMLGDTQAVLPLINLLKMGLQNGKLVPEQPDFSQPYDAILEALGTLQAQEYIHLTIPFLQHPIERIEYSAARAMYQLTKQDSYAEILVQALAKDELQSRRTAIADLGAIGYLPAAEAIAETPVANSLRLIALKGLLEYQLKINQSPPEVLSDRVIKIMSLMDSLL